jgi:ribosomal protein S18 acetylase RimI-like enzyme
VQIRPLVADDRAWLEDFVRERWGASIVVGHGRIFRPAELAGFVALDGDEPVGLATYVVVNDACELVTIDSVHEQRGIGSALLEAVEQLARDASCRRIWLITTNDNLTMLRFVQKRGYRLVALRPNELEKSRKLKPGISTHGLHGIPIRDELELEKLL